MRMVQAAGVQEGMRQARISALLCRRGWRDCFFPRWSGCLGPTAPSANGWAGRTIPLGQEAFRPTPASYFWLVLNRGSPVRQNLFFWLLANWSGWTAKHKKSVTAPPCQRNRGPECWGAAAIKCCRAWPGHGVSPVKPNSPLSAHTNLPEVNYRPPSPGGFIRHYVSLVSTWGEKGLSITLNFLQHMEFV